MNGLAVDLRERVVAAVVVAGLSQVAAARRFGLDRSSVGRFVRAWQAGESLEPRAGGGRPRRLHLPGHVAALRESLESDPDLELAERGERLAQSEGNRGKNTSIRAAMGSQGQAGTMIVEGAINKEVFWTYLDRVLCPALRPGQIVVMDNLAAHKNETLREKIEACGARRQPGLQPQRARVCQAQGLPAQSQGAHPCGARSRHHRRTRHPHHPERTRLVQPLSRRINPFQAAIRR